MVKEKSKINQKHIKKSENKIMKITGTIKFPDPKSKETATRALQALAPDNLRSMESEISDNKIGAKKTSSF